MIALLAYAAVTAVTTIWYLIAADTGSATPNPQTGQVFEITNRVITGSTGGLKYGGSTVGYMTPAYVGLISYCVCWVAFINWIVLVLAGIWRFLRQV